LSKEYKSQVYECNTLHFHANSEHKINGKKYDAEMHMVFKAAGPKVFHEEICVIGVFFRINPIKASEDKRAIIKSMNPRMEGVFI
jgi:carbonic anhydrase